jgi:23S rRNA pseudouridine1911/1915/1917 synthase
MGHGRLQLPAGIGPACAAALTGFRRQALHAARLSLRHPATGATMTWEAPLPTDFAALLATLSADV